MIKKTYLFILILCAFSEVLGQSYELGHTTITFNDVNRSGGFGSGGGPGRQIQTEIYYPSLVVGNDVALANGVFPVIVFGHGFAMVWSAYENIWEDFAIEGYILAFPRTEGSLLPPPSHGDFGEDLALVETRMQALNLDASSLFYQKVSPNSAIIGHSMGGGAAFLACANNSSPSLKAVVGLAPAETNPSAIAAALNTTVDALILSGSSDGVTPPSSNHQPIYDNLASNCKTFLSITNGSHCYFANSNFNCDFGELTTGTGSLSRGEQQDISQDYMKLFLDFKLKSSCLAWDEFLDSLAVSTRVVEQQQCTYTYVQPSASINGDSVFCEGTNSLLWATADSAYNYTWFRDSINLNNTNDSLTSSLAGSYSLVVSNNLGCTDSSDLFQTNTWDSYNLTDTVFACQGSTYTFPDGTSTTIDSTHLSALTSVNGCDSLISRTVFFGTSVSGNFFLDLCLGDSFIYNSSIIRNDTAFADTLINGSAFLCDSITNLSIAFREPDTVRINPAICQGENYQLPNGLFVNYTDSFYFTYSNQQLCDSIYFVDLIVGATLGNISTSVYNFNSGQGDTIIMALDQNISYDSLFWEVDSSLVLLATLSDSAFFYVLENLNTYQVSLSLFNDGCESNTTNTITLSSIKSPLDTYKIEIYPNPCQDWISIKGLNIENFEITDLLGRTLINSTIYPNSYMSNKIKTSSLVPGWYILRTKHSQTLFLKQ